LSEIPIWTHQREFGLSKCHLGPEELGHSEQEAEGNGRRLAASNVKSSIIEERILCFAFVPSIVEEQILRFFFVPSIVGEQILHFVFLPSLVEEQILWFVFVPLYKV
jgi:hypothetical protein